VLFFTDGLVESRHGDIGLGLARLRALASAARQWPLSEFCDRILLELAGGTNEDDVTLLAVRIPAGHD
jgi:serine phosphatase RsbU (regulator of sigma subunit)